MRFLFLSFISAIVFLSACKKSSTEQESKSFSVSGDTIHIFDDTPLQKKLIIEPVTEEPFLKEVVTAGTVQAIPTQYAYIAPPFSGRVTKSYIKLGQQVNANTPLFDVVSADFTAAQKEFYQAQSEYSLAQNDLKRKQDLIKNGVASQKELEEAANALKIAEKEFENASAAIKIYQVDPNNMILGQPLIVRSPIKGKVISDNIVTGQYIKEDTEPVAIVADLSQVWVVGQVKEKDIQYIHEGDDIEINLAAGSNQAAVKGKVFRIDEAVDEDTRSIKVFALCDNTNNYFKLGMYTTIHFFDQPIEAILVPEKALLQDADNSYVFVQISPNTYIKKVVETEGTKDGKVVISKGLNKGEQIIAEGGYYLK